MAFSAMSMALDARAHVPNHALSCVMHDVAGAFPNLWGRIPFASPSPAQDHTGKMADLR